MVRTDLNPTREQIRMHDHCNIMGLIVSQEQLAPNLWEIIVDASLLSRMMGVKQTQLTFYVDHQIEWKRPAKPVLTAGFTIVIRHMYECVDADGVVYYFIAAGTIMEPGANQPFRAACYRGN